MTLVHERDMNIVWDAYRVAIGTIVVEQWRWLVYQRTVARIVAQQWRSRVLVAKASSHHIFQVYRMVLASFTNVRAFRRTYRNPS